MKTHKKELGIICASLVSLPLVAADLAPEPLPVTVPIIAFAILGVCIVGAVFLIRWIIRNIKKKE
jgi:O-antigen/teichoic acid export membrane protein